MFSSNLSHIPPLFLLNFVLFCLLKPLRSLNAVSMYTGAGLSTGAWVAFPGPHLQRKLTPPLPAASDGQ